MTSIRPMSFVGSVATPCELTLDDFQKIRVLGEGTFGRVMLAQKKDDRQIFAIKILSKDRILKKATTLAHTLTENAVLRNCNHPFLTELRYSFQTSDYLCFVMEYVSGGELFFHLSKEVEQGRTFSEIEHGFLSRRPPQRPHNYTSRMSYTVA